MNNLAICEEISTTIGDLFSCSIVGEYIKVRTPYLYPDGDVLDLFIKPNGETLTLTDLGETLRWLSMQTYAKQRSRKQDILIEDICLTHRIEFFKGMFLARIQKSESLVYALVRLAQTALQVADLSFTFKNKEFFSIKEEVEDLLIESEISYERNYRVSGTSGRMWNMDFYVRNSQRTSLIHVLSTGSRASAQNLTTKVFTEWYDLRGLLSRSTSIRFISLVDDTVDIWSPDNLSLLEEFSEVIYWSQPEILKEQLSQSAS